LTALENRKRNLKQAVDSLKDLQRSVEEERAAITEDKRKVMDMERGYASSDEEGDIGSSSGEEEEERVEEDKKYTSHRFQERKSDDEDEEGIVLDTPMVE
jgi:hypothetical protein